MKPRTLLFILLTLIGFNYSALSEEPDFIGTLVANRWSWLNVPIDRVKNPWTERRFDADGTATAWTDDVQRCTGRWEITGPRTVRIQNITQRNVHILTFDSAMTSYEGVSEDGRNRYNGKRLTNNVPKPVAQNLPNSKQPQPKPTVTLPPKASPLTPGQPDPLVGRWRQANATITTILPNSIAENGAPGRPSYNGKWTRDGSRYIIDWTDGLYIDTLRVSGGNKLMRFGKDGRWSDFATRIR